MEIVEVGPTTDFINISDAEKALLKLAAEEVRYILDGGTHGLGSRWQSIDLRALGMTKEQADKFFEQLEVA